MKPLNQNKMKKTAVEWLEEQLINNKELISLDFQQAKEMEKEHIINSFNVGESLGDRRNYTGIDYYNETYGSMITDIPITNKDKEELNEILNKIQRNLTFKSE
jgi:rhodanese-related sulfurtransferase